MRSYVMSTPTMLALGYPISAVAPQIFFFFFFFAKVRTASGIIELYSYSSLFETTNDIKSLLQGPRPILFSLSPSTELPSSSFCFMGKQIGTNLQKSIPLGQPPSSNLNQEANSTRCVYIPINHPIALMSSTTSRSWSRVSHPHPPRTS